MCEEILYLTREDVEAVGVQMPEIIQVLDQTFKEKGEGRYEMPPKPGIHPGQDAFMHAMPAYVPIFKRPGSNGTCQAAARAKTQMTARLLTRAWMMTAGQMDPLFWYR
ncbi:MAG: hypothetical protein R6U55_09695 [Desulfovermiculus sp.]